MRGQAGPCAVAGWVRGEAGQPLHLLPPNSNLVQTQFSPISFPYLPASLPATATTRYMCSSRNGSMYGATYAIKARFEGFWPASLVAPQWLVLALVPPRQRPYIKVGGSGWRCACGYV